MDWGGISKEKATALVARLSAGRKAAEALVVELRAAGLTVEARGNGVVVRPVARLTADQRRRIKEHKTDLLVVLRGTPKAQAPEGEEEDPLAGLDETERKLVACALAAISGAEATGSAMGWVIEGPAGKFRYVPATSGEGQEDGAAGEVSDEQG